MEETKRYAWRCKRCYTISPESSRVCSKRQCGANLSIFGEMGELDEYDNWSLVTNYNTRTVAPPEVIILEPVQEVAKEPKPEKVKEPKPKKIKEPKPKKIKEPKPKKVKAPKPPKVRQSDTGGSKKGGLIMLLILMVLAFLAAIFGLIWYMTDGFSGKEEGSSKKEKSTTTAEKPDDPDPDPDPDTIYAPDFGYYMDDAAILVTSKKKSDYWLYKYDVSTYYAEEAIDEYVDLLEDEYEFEFSDDYKTRAWFLYTGTSPITTLNSDINGTEYHIEIILGDDKNGTTSIEFHYAKEIELEDPGVRYDLPEQEAFVVPDFNSFADGYVSRKSSGTQGSYMIYNYYLPQGAKEIIAEYGELILTEYRFVESDNCNVSEYDTEEFYVFYTNSQASHIPTDSLTVNNRSYEYHLCVGLQITAKDEIVIAMVLADGFELVDDGYRTSFDDRVIPEFEQWATSDDVEKGASKNISGGFIIQFYNLYMDEATFSFAYKEFCDYIESQYCFELAGTGTDQSESAVFYNHWFRYTGRKSVSTTTDTDIDGNTYENSLCVYWYENSDGYLTIGIIYSEDLELVTPLTQSTEI